MADDARLRADSDWLTLRVEVDERDHVLSTRYTDTHCRGGFCDPWGVRGDLPSLLVQAFRNGWCIAGVERRTGGMFWWSWAHTTIWLQRRKA